MKPSILILLSILLIGCNSSDNLSTSKNVKETNLEKSKKTEYSNHTVNLENTNNKPKLINKNFSARGTLESLQNSNDTRKLVYLIHPDEEVIAYCYQALRSECYIKGVVNDYYFEHDITAIEIRNIGGITINDVQSAQTTPTEWINLTDEYIAIKMETKVTMDSKIYTYYDYLIINFDDRGIFWQ